MSFIREMGNVAVTLGAFHGTRLGVNHVLSDKNNPLARTFKLAAPTAACYFANKYMGEKNQEEIKEAIRQRAVKKLIANGMGEEQALNAFEQHYDAAPLRKPGFFRTVGNIMSTWVMSNVGIRVTTMLANSLTSLDIKKNDRKPSNILSDIFFGHDDLNTKGWDMQGIAKKAVVIFGAMTGGYFGNKFLQGPAKSAYEERASDIVAKILAERAPAGEELSQVEKLRMRQQQGMNNGVRMP
jgi:hypothetical protein